MAPGDEPKKSESTPPAPPPAAESHDPGAAPHVRSAWRSWLSALASDAEAALAAALAYESLPADGRDAWLDALDADGPAIDVPAIALYAPLLAVEADEARRARIRAGMESRRGDAAAGPGQSTASARPVRALRGVGPDGTHVCLITMPLYLDFVQVLACRYTPAGGFVEARVDPLVHQAGLAAMRDVGGVAVEPTPLHLVVEELAHAVLADRREGRAAPAPVSTFAHLFGPGAPVDAAEDGAPPSP
jgi:hypothetical protein